MARCGVNAVSRYGVDVDYAKVTKDHTIFGKNSVNSRTTKSQRNSKQKHIMTTQTTIDRRKAHHVALETIALTVGCTTPGLKLWRDLGRLERKVHQACEDYSNDSNFGLERWETVKDEARQELSRIFGGTIPKGVYINGDPRGHSLKLDCDVAPVPGGMERDWGGNGILASTID